MYVHRQNRKNTATIVNNNVNIYPEQNNDNSTKEEASSSISDTKQTSNDSIKFTILGEIMMGGQVSTNLNYTYMPAFTSIYNLTTTSDFTYSTLGTDITNLSKIDSDAKSKYLVTKDIISSLNVLGIDSISVATDHIVDFSDDIFKNTVDILNQNKVYAAGLNNTPVYLEKGSKKIAIIASNDVVIGTSTNYTRNNVNIYDQNKMKQDIETAKQNADFVVVDVNWGREYTYGVTDRMKQIAQNAIDSGADLVVGSNALGIYPLVEYKSKPIIYSTGYLMTDSDYNLAKQSYIFDVNINKDSKIDSIELNPIYIENKDKVDLYFDYKADEAQEYITQMNEWNIQNGLNSSIENNKVLVKF